MGGLARNTMIEIEKGFFLNKDSRERLLEGAEFVSKKTFTDIYFDKKDYSLTLKDNWLRSRDGKFELKLTLNPDWNREVDQYNEIETDKEILEFLKLPMSENIETSLRDAKYLPFCTCTTERDTYKFNEFRIDIDHVTYSDWDQTYDISEIELLVEGKAGVAEATQKILEFAKSRGVNDEERTGKVGYYMRTMRPEHAAALIEVGVFSG